MSEATYRVHSDVEIYAAGQTGRGSATVAVFGERPAATPGSIPIPRMSIEGLEGRLLNIQFNDGNSYTGALGDRFEGMVLMSSEAWGLRGEIATVKLQRSYITSTYAGTFRLPTMPKGVVQQAGETRAAPLPAIKEEPPESLINELTREQVVAGKFAEVVGQTTAIKAFIRDYLTTEPSPFEIAILRALAAEIDVIQSQVNVVLQSADTRPAIRQAVDVIKWFIVAVGAGGEALKHLGVLVSQLESLLRTLGV